MCLQFLLSSKHIYIHTKMAGPFCTSAFRLLPLILPRIDWVFRFATLHLEAVLFGALALLVTTSYKKSLRSVFSLFLTKFPIQQRFFPLISHAFDALSTITRPELTGRRLISHFLTFRDYKQHRGNYSRCNGRTALNARDSALDFSQAIQNLKSPV